MENMNGSFSKWFYLGLVGIVLGLILIYNGKGKNKSKSMENGYFIMILGFIGVVSEWTDFANVLCALLLICIFFILIDKLFLSKTKVAKVDKPHYIYYSYDFFPVLFVVFGLRAFFFEVYEIPSSSMRPSLLVGDFVLVNKYFYGIREPFTNKVLYPINEINRGDVVVFKDKLVRNRDLIKRVIGIGGDKIEYYAKRLTVNGKVLDYTSDGNYTYMENFPGHGDVQLSTDRYVENLFGVSHKIITMSQVPTVVQDQVLIFNDKGNCTYHDNDGFTCIVPKGEYFMMGDNRDNSFDSRYWGFVTNKSVLGKAYYVVANFHEFPNRFWVKI